MLAFFISLIVFLAIVGSALLLLRTAHHPAAKRTHAKRSDPIDRS